MSLISPADVRALVQTGVNDTVLQALIDREEAEVIRLCGPHYVNANTPVTVMLEGGFLNLYLPRSISSVTAITEDEEALSEDAEGFRVWKAQGRIQRLPAGSKWGAVIDLSYVPADDSLERKTVIIELVRLALERTALRSENVAGEYSYSAPEWERERAVLLRRLRFWEV